MKIKTINPLFISIILLTGCTSSTNSDDSVLSSESNVEGAIKDNTAQSVSVEGITLPDKDFDDTYTYKNYDKKSPFYRDMGAQDSGIVPDFDRDREKLEEYSLSSISLKGIISLKNNEREAMFLTNDGRIYSSGVGNYIGQNYGLITSVGEEEVEIRELHRGNNGIWEAQISTLSKN